MITKLILEELQEYIERHLNPIMISEAINYSKQMEHQILEDLHSSELEDFIKTKRQPTFQKVLFQYIDKKEATDVEIYKKAGLDRKLFSKIRSKADYHPRKNTIISLALALELNIKETDKLLSSAGYSLSESETFDLVIQFCIEKKIHDLDDVNQALDYFSLKPLNNVM